MNKKQENKVLKVFKNYDVESDKLDYKALWDNKITDEENLNNLQEKIEQLASSKDNHKKIENDKKVKKQNIKEEKKETERILLEQLKEQEKITEKQFNKSFEKLKKSNSEIINNLFYVPIEFIKSVAYGYNNSFIFLGQQGQGKTYITLQTLIQEKTDFVYKQGFLTPLQIYKFLYENKDNKVIVFDDVSGIISNLYSLSLILSALWSSTGKRKVSWNSTTGKLDIPKEFIFNSRIIFIANKIPSNDYAEVVMSRCLNYEINLSYQDLIKIMTEIARKETELKPQERLEIVDFIKENTDETTKNFDLRLQKKIENLYLYDKEKWKDLSLALLNKKNEKLALVKKLLMTSTYIKEAVDDFRKQTGLSSRQFYRYKKLLTS